MLCVGQSTEAPGIPGAPPRSKMDATAGEAGGVLDQLMRLHAGLQGLGASQARIEHSLGSLQKDLKGLTSKVASQGGPRGSFSLDPPQPATQGGALSPRLRVQQRPAVGAEPRVLERRREAGARSLCADFTACCEKPERVYIGIASETKAGSNRAQPQQPEALQQPPQLEQEFVLSPNLSQLLPRSSTGDSNGVDNVNRQHRAKAWQKKAQNQSVTASQVVGIEAAFQKTGRGQPWKKSKTRSVESPTVAHEPSSAALEKVQERRGVFARLVLSPPFEHLCMLFVLVAVVLQGYEVEYMAERALVAPPAFLQLLQSILTMFFCFELLLRVCVHRGNFFSGLDASWNILDTVIVGLSIFELVLDSVSMMEATASTSIRALRVLRVLRIVRVVRIIRVFRFFKELRMMVYSILACFRSLFWVVTLLFIVLYTCATFLTQVVTDYRATATSGDLLAAELGRDFGSLPLSIYNLFQTVSGGVDWGDIAEPVKSLHWLYALFFVVFVCFTLFAVLNIVTGVFVEGALERAQMDKEAMIQSEMDEHREKGKQLEKVFQEIDVDGSGILEFGEFEQLMQDNRVKAWFRTMGLQVDTAVQLFQLLDLDNSQTISASEFVMGCMRLQGGAKNVDVATLMYENKRMMMKWTAFMDFVEEKFEELQAFIGSTLTGVDSGSNAWVLPSQWAATDSRLNAGVEFAAAGAGAFSGR